MDNGTVFEYDVIIEQSDEDSKKRFVERYELTSIDDLCLLFRVSGDPKGVKDVEGNVGYASGIFDILSLRRSGKENIAIGSDVVDVDVYVSDRCGGGETVWVGPDNIAYKDVRTQLWSKGVLYKETRTLIAFSKI